MYFGGILKMNSHTKNQLAKFLLSLPPHELSTHEHLFWLYVNVVSEDFEHISNHIKGIEEIDFQEAIIFIPFLSAILFVLLVFKQYYAAHKILSSVEYRQYLKTFWYASIYFSSSEQYNDEYLRMGEEIKSLTEKLIYSIQKEQVIVSQMPKEQRLGTKKIKALPPHSP
jgi:Na+/phosphate symporter